MLVPAITALGGTVASHSILKNTKFTSRQGWNINYATIAGVVIGLGVSLAIQPDSHNIYFIVPVATGMAGWAILVSKYKKQQFADSSHDKKRWTDLSFSFTPQNYFINKQIRPSEDNPRRSGLPLFSLKLRL
jgi:phage shock protein PspC (stress-responsive transcriptional regulator)